jgi:hypothetical protein
MLFYLDQGFVRDLVINSVGEYTAAEISNGNYRITAGLLGFQQLHIWDHPYGPTPTRFDPSVIGQP